MSDVSATSSDKPAGKKAPAKKKAPETKTDTKAEQAVKDADKTQVADTPAEKAKAAGAGEASAEKTPTAAEPAAQSPAPTGEKPAAAKAVPGEQVKPAEPPEPPFTTDQLQSSTARFTHKAWHLYYSNRQDMDFIRQTPVRASLEARTTSGAEELHKSLTDAGVQEISRQDKTLFFTATFETIQTVIRHPQTYMLDAVRI